MPRKAIVYYADDFAWNGIKRVFRRVQEDYDGQFEEVRPDGRTVLEYERDVHLPPDRVSQAVAEILNPDDPIPEWGATPWTLPQDPYPPEPVLDI